MSHAITDRQVSQVDRVRVTMDLDLRRSTVGAAGVIRTVLKVIKATLDFIEKVARMDEAGNINFGTFYLTGNAASDPNHQTTSADVRGAKRDDGGLTDEQRKTLAGPSQEGLDGKDSRTGNATTSGRTRIGAGVPSRLLPP